MEKLIIDDNIFKLFYKLTFWMLLASAGLLFLEVRSPMSGISCEPYVQDCWKQLRILYHNVSGHDFSGEPITLQIWTALYLWTPLLLVVQAVAFWLPHALWIHLEDNTIAHLVDGMQYSASMIMYASDEYNFEVITEFINRMAKSAAVRFVAEMKSGNWYLWNYSVCHLLNLVMVPTQIYLISYLFGIEFISYGPRYVSLMHSDNLNSTKLLDFPTTVTANCEMLKFQNFEYEHREGICILGINTYNALFFLVIWFWFAFIATISCIKLLWMLAITLERCSLKCNLARYGRRLNVDLSHLEKYAKPRDMFVLNQMVKNIPDRKFFTKFIAEVNGLIGEFEGKNVIFPAEIEIYK